MPSPTALVVEDGSGKVDANTYVSLADADAYLTDNPHTTLWEDTTEDVKTWALMSATRLMDTYMKWEGSRQTETQALEWPRSGGKNRCSGQSIPENYIPKNITNACIELAYDQLVSDKTRPTSTEQSQISKLKVDVLEISYDTPLANQETSVSSTAVISDSLKAMLRCYGVTATGATSGGVKFGRLIRR